MKTSQTYIFTTLFLSSLAMITGCGYTENPSAPNVAQTDVAQPALQKSGSIAPGVVSWWPADGNADDIIDGNNGTLKNGATFASGQVGQAFSMDGAGFVEVADANNLDINEMTIDAWIYVNVLNPAFGGNARIVDKNTGGFNDGYLLDIIGGKLRLHAGNTNFTGTQDVSLNTWTHVAGTYDGSLIKLYIDGKLVDTSPPTAGLPTPTNNLSLLIGEAHPIGVFAVKWHGAVDEVEIYNRALSASEINATFKAGSKGNKPKKMVEICHKPGTPAEKTLVIPYHALPGHIGHGDMIGTCE